MTNVPSTFTGDYQTPHADRWTARSRVARRFFLVAIVVVAAASLIAAALMRWFGRPEGLGLQFPAAFALTTLLLGLGSGLLEGALRAIRLERQARFHRRLWQSIAIGTLFMGVQTYALWTIVPAGRSAEAASLGVTPFVLMLAVLHGLHFLVATLFVSYVAAQASLGRYDHEYHWGVTVCAAFWHVLGIAWLAVLAVYVIAFR